MLEHRYYHDRITMALDDLLRCQEYCQMMLKISVGKPFTDDRTVYEALFIAFIITYGKLFTTSNTVDNSMKSEVSNRFGKFRAQMIDKQEIRLKKLHERIIHKRDKAIAHSDATSVNYQHFHDSPIGLGRNPYFPYDHEEVEWALELTKKLISLVGDEQSRVGKIAFKNDLFGIANDRPKSD